MIKQVNNAIAIIGCLSVSIVLLSSPCAVAADALTNSFDPSALASFRAAIAQGGWFLPSLLAMAAGALTALSPCVYPLIPITLSVIGARRYDSKTHGLSMAMAYVLGMTTLYATLGTIFASLGLMLGAVMQHPTVLMIIALIFFLSALSMLDAFTVALPSRLTAKLARVGGYGLKGAFFMGLVAGLIATPCTGPVLGFILTLIANRGDVALGILLMACFSGGLGLPFLLLGAFSSAIARLPKSGPWMSTIKHLLGAAMLGAAIYYASLSIDGIKWPVRWLSSLSVLSLSLMLVLGILLLLIGGRQFSSRYMMRLSLIFGSSLSAIAIASFLWQPSLEDIATKEVDGLDWYVLDASTKGTDSLDRLLKSAADQGMPVMIDFFAEWCAACHRLEATFNSLTILPTLSDFFLIRIDATKSSPMIDRLQSRYRVLGLPTLLFFDRQGREATSARISGFVTPQQLMPILDRLKNFSHRQSDKTANLANLMDAADKPRQVERGH